MATGPSPSTASTEINLAQQAIQLLHQSQGQSGTDRKTIEKVVFKLRVKELKEVCREFKVKISKANKAALCGRIISYWQTGLFREDKFCSPTCSADSPLSVTTPLIRQSLKKLGKLSCFSGDWKRDLSLLSDFTFMDLFTYLVESKDNTFDQGSMRAFKSLKAFRYFADGYVQNVWATEVNQASDLLIIRCYCFSSLKCGTTYPVFVCLSRNGDVYSAECKCVARLGEACSHVAALLFYLEDCVQRRDKVLPDNSTCTDKLQQWHIPPKRTINPAPVSDIEFRKTEYGKEQDRPKPTLYDPRHPNDQTLNPEHVSTMLDNLKTTCPTSGIHQFWNLSGE